MKFSGVFLVGVIVSRDAMFGQQNKQIFQVKTKAFGFVYDVDVRPMLFAAAHGVLTFENQHAVGLQYAVKFRQRGVVKIPQRFHGWEPVETFANYARWSALCVTRYEWRVKHDGFNHAVEMWQIVGACLQRVVGLREQIKFFQGFVNSVGFVEITL